MVYCQIPRKCMKSNLQHYFRTKTVIKNGISTTKRFTSHISLMPTKSLAKTAFARGGTKTVPCLRSDYTALHNGDEGGLGLSFQCEGGTETNLGRGNSQSKIVVNLERGKKGCFQQFPLSRLICCLWFYDEERVQQQIRRTFLYLTFILRKQEEQV